MTAAAFSSSTAGLNTSRMHDGCRQASNTDGMVADHSVLAVHCDEHKILAVQSSKLLAEALEKIAGVLESRIVGENFC
jgi:hypothetical protein